MTAAERSSVEAAHSAHRVHTETVSLELAERVLQEYERDQREGRAATASACGVQKLDRAAAQRFVIVASEAEWRLQAPR
jgi:hypothetical protein